MFQRIPSPSTAPVACHPDAIPSDERGRWLDVGRKVFRSIQAVQELADGYAYRLPGDRQTLLDLAEYVSRDRLCCQFLRWEIRVEPELGEVWLVTTGSASAKLLLRESLETTDMVLPEVAEAAGLDVSRRAPVDERTVDAVADRVNRAATRRS